MYGATCISEPGKSRQYVGGIPPLTSQPSAHAKLAKERRKSKIKNKKSDEILLFLLMPYFPYFCIIMVGPIPNATNEETR